MKMTTTIGIIVIMLGFLIILLDIDQSDKPYQSSIHIVDTPEWKAWDAKLMEYSKAVDVFVEYSSLGLKTEYQCQLIIVKGLKAETELLYKLIPYDKYK